MTYFKPQITEKDNPTINTKNCEKNELGRVDMVFH